ncbi:MAG: 3-oxo-5-alpha-steroid 4-dehydrogenase [Anaerolineales bacterium]|nr:3-oxo-5-alpha-steroid 4-dehydrogenase [Anaerolineales bacterium]MDW8277391.1 hypothetical protein [Anaerolineales bacterium]
MIFPEWNTFNIALYSGLALLSLGMGLGEALGLKMMKYSKFRPSAGWNPRAGMFFLYFLPILAALAFALPYLPTASLAQVIVLTAVLGHFAKRCLEVLFLHKYSGPIDPFTTLAIASFYTLVAGFLSALNRQPLPAPDGLFWLGLFLFVFGESANFVHHKLLADLRRETDGYVIPRGGWFEHVACPHYFFEIIAWIGIALLSRHLFAWIALVGMAGYLIARSHNTLTWYRQKFPDFPKHRKALIPFLL